MPQGAIQPPPYLLASISLCSGSHFWFLCWFQVFVVFDGGYEATPLWVARVPLCVGGSIPHQGGRHILKPPPDMEGYLPISLPPPCLALPTMTHFG